MGPENWDSFCRKWGVQLLGNPTGSIWDRKIGTVFAANRVYKSWATYAGALQKILNTYAGALQEIVNTYAGALQKIVNTHVGA